MRQMAEVPDSTSPDRLLVAFVAHDNEPCRVLRAALGSVAGELHGRLRVDEVDVAEDVERAGRHNVQVVPTLVLLEAGREVRRYTGSRPAQQLRAELLEAVPELGRPVSPRRERRVTRWGVSMTGRTAGLRSLALGSPEIPELAVSAGT